MKITIFGATGDLGSECLTQSLELGHEVTVLVRTPSKLSSEMTQKITVVQGDVLDASDVANVINSETQVVLFCIGVDSKSPQDLCTTATKHILAEMQAKGESTCRFVWCGGGSTFLSEDQITGGAKFVRFFAQTFMSKRHNDKEHQFQMLQEEYTKVKWFGIRPLQMNPGKLTKKYRLGYDTFSGLSKISFADCAHAMIEMTVDDTWERKAPIIQY